MIEARAWPSRRKPEFFLRSSAFLGSVYPGNFATHEDDCNGHNKRPPASLELSTTPIYAALKTVVMLVPAGAADAPSSSLGFWRMRHDQGVRLCQHGADHSRSFACWEARHQL